MPQVGMGTTMAWAGTTVVGLTSINGIELTAEVVDNTTITSANFFKENSPGMLSAGDVVLGGFFESADAGQTAMLTDMLARTTRSGVITFPNASSWNFSGFIKSLKIGDVGTSGNIPFTAAISITGKPNFAATASTGMTGVVFSNSGVVAPTFAVGTYDYVVTVLTGIASVTITPTAAAGVILVNGNVVATGQASSAIVLGAAGSITIATVTVTEANKTPKTYVFRITRP